jgi:hypothetical protein
MSHDEERDRFWKKALLTVAAVAGITAVAIGLRTFTSEREASPVSGSAQRAHATKAGSILAGTEPPPPQPHEFNIPSGVTIADALLDISWVAAARDHLSFFSRPDTGLDTTSLIQPIRGTMFSLDAFCAVIRQAPGWRVVRIDNKAGAAVAVVVTNHEPTGQEGTTFVCGDVPSTPS